MARRHRHRLLLAGAAFFALGVVALLTAPMNNRFEGWGLLVRALAGEALIVGAVDCAVRGATGRSSRAIRRKAVIVLSIVLAPAALLALLVSKESGSSWSMAAMTLLVWFVVTCVLAAFLPGGSEPARDD